MIIVTLTEDKRTNLTQRNFNFYSVNYSNHYKVLEGTNTLLG